MNPEPPPTPPNYPSFIPRYTHYSRNTKVSIRGPLKGGVVERALEGAQSHLGLLGGSWVVTIGASIITYIILGVPYYKYSIMGPQKPYSNY